MPLFHCHPCSYDRGHMAPASNHKTTQATMDETFSLTNMSPQARLVE